MRSLSLSKNRSLSSSATLTSRSSNTFFSWAPRLSTSTSLIFPDTDASIPRLTRLYVGSFSSAAHRSASSSSSSRDDLEKTSPVCRHTELLRLKLPIFDNPSTVEGSISTLSFPSLIKLREGI